MTKVYDSAGSMIIQGIFFQLGQRFLGFFQGLSIVGPQRGNFPKQVVFSWNSLFNRTGSSGSFLKL